MFSYKYRPTVNCRHVYSCRQPSHFTVASHTQISNLCTSQLWCLRNCSRIFYLRYHSYHVFILRLSSGNSNVRVCILKSYVFTYYHVLCFKTHYYFFRKIILQNLPFCILDVKFQYYLFINYRYSVLNIYISIFYYCVAFLSFVLVA